MDCNKDMIEEVLTQAQQIGMMSEDFYYLLTSLDAHTVDLHAFKVTLSAQIHTEFLDHQNLVDSRYKWLKQFRICII